MKNFISNFSWWIGFVIGIVIVVTAAAQCSRLNEYKKPKVIHERYIPKPAIEFEKPKIKSGWKPKYTTKFNQAKWVGDGFESVLLNECGKCSKVCWVTSEDKGGPTCLGFSMRDNSDLFIEILNRSFDLCRNQGISWTDKDPFGKIKDFCYIVRKAYWDRYVEKYKNCDYKALMHLSDTAILQGHKATALIHQRAHGLKADGMWGEKSQSMCLKGLWDKRSYIAERQKYLKNLKQFDRFGEGWLKRVNRMDKRY